MLYVLAYDIGTTGMKACLFELGDKIRLLADAYREYELYVLPDGGAEQDTEQWWESRVSATKELMADAKVSPGEIAGISFCSQMQGLVLVDRDLNPVRKPMSYMDQRAVREMKEIGARGITVAGLNIRLLLHSLLLTKAAPTSVKDPIWKYKWVEKNEPENFEKIYKWLDVKEFFIAKCTGRCIMTKDSAYSTFLYDTRTGKEGFSDSLCRIFGVKREHLPEVISCTDVAGTLTKKAADELGLQEGTKVYGGGGDATLIGVGAGCTKVGQTHIYSGTSGWVETVLYRQIVSIDAMIAGIVGAQKGRYNYFAEMETAGKCFEWVRDHLALDEIDIYLQKMDVAKSKESVYESLYDYLSEVIAKVPAGAGGVIFTPWLHGNRCPFEDPKAAGMFFNISLDTGKSHLLRAVLEGICYHLNWMLECQDKRVKTARTIRFVGGGALSGVTCQMLADITGRVIETVENTKEAGAVGAAILVGIEQRVIADFDEVEKYIQVKASYTPIEENRKVYDRYYQVFKKLYQSNRENFAVLNRQTDQRR